MQKASILSDTVILSYCTFVVRAASVQRPCSVRAAARTVKSAGRTSVRPPHGRRTDNNLMSVRRPSGAARTSVRHPCGLKRPDGRPCGRRTDIECIVRAASVHFFGVSVRRRTDPSGAGRIRTAPDGMSPLLIQLTEYGVFCFQYKCESVSILL